MRCRRRWIRSTSACSTASCAACWCSRRRSPQSRWLPFVTDSRRARRCPPASTHRRLHALALRRHAELDAAIDARRWFDPWIFEVDADAAQPPTSDTDPDDEDDRRAVRSRCGLSVGGWIRHRARPLSGADVTRGQALDAALVLLYRHLDPDDLEDADEILQAIENSNHPRTWAWRWRNWCARRCCSPTSAGHGAKAAAARRARPRRAAERQRLLAASVAEYPRGVQAEAGGNARQAVALHHARGRKGCGDALRKRQQPGGSAGEEQGGDALRRHAGLGDGVLRSSHDRRHLAVDRLERRAAEPSSTPSPFSTIARSIRVDAPARWRSWRLRHAPRAHGRGALRAP